MCALEYECYNPLKVTLRQMPSCRIMEVSLFKPKLKLCLAGLIVKLQNVNFTMLYTLPIELEF